MRSCRLAMRKSNLPNAPQLDIEETSGCCHPSFHSFLGSRMVELPRSSANAHLYSFVPFLAMRDNAVRVVSNLFSRTQQGCELKAIYIPGPSSSSSFLLSSSHPRTNLPLRSRDNRFKRWSASSFIHFTRPIVTHSSGSCSVLI